MPGRVLGIEMDGGFLPSQYRAPEGSRIVAHGRWIVDDGHPDFHTEIHPPLLLAWATVTPGPRFQGNLSSVAGAIIGGATASPFSGFSTFSRVIGCPNLVSQLFERDGRAESLRKDFVDAAGNFLTPFASEVEARPAVFAQPFKGKHVLIYSVSPPSQQLPPLPPGHLWQLTASFHFLVRNGCSVQVVKSGSEAVSVTITLDEAGYSTPPLPARQDVNVDVNQYLGALPAGTLSSGDEFLVWLANLASGLSAQGDPMIVTYSYTSPPFPASIHEAKDLVWSQPVESLPADSGADTDDRQPFPVSGLVNIGWLPAPAPNVTA